MKRCWIWFTALPAGKRVLLTAFVSSGVAGGVLLNAALAHPNHAETVLVVIGAMWAAVTLLAGLLGWLADRRGRKREP